MKRYLLALCFLITGIVIAHAQSQYIAPYQGAVTRTVSSKLSDIVSVLDFGVDKTGVVDASPILTTMQSQVPANSPIIFPLGGTYRINTNVAMTGRIVYRNGATFVGSGSITGALFADFPVPLGSGGNGGSQEGATNGQIPVMNVGRTAYVPTSVPTLFDNICSSTIGYAWARFTGGWACGANAIADVRYWGALCNGSANDTTPINTAFASGAKWFLIPETCNVTGLNSPPTGARIDGGSRFIGILQTTSATADVLPVTNSNVTITNLGFNSTVTRTAGAYIKTTGVGIFTLSNFYMVNGFNGLDLGATIARVSDGDIRDIAAAGTRVIVNGGTDQYFDRIIGDNTAGNALAGFDIQATGAVWITNSDMIHSGNGLNIAPTGTNVVSWAFISNSAFDTGSGTGINISPTDTAAVQGVFCHQCWTSSNVIGIAINKAVGATADGIEFVGHRAIANSQRGVLAIAGNNISFIGGIISGNSSGSSGTYDGMIFSNVTGLKVEGVTSGVAANNGNSQKINLVIADATDHYTITGNYLCGFNTAALSDTASGTFKTVHSNDCAVNTGTTGTGAIALKDSPVFTTNITTPIAHLSGTSNQLVFQSAGVTGTMSWAPTSTNKTLIWPNGTTDFTSTGGTSQVVKQVSAGAAFTVGQLACSDLSGVGSGCSAAFGTGVATALAINVGSPGAPVTLNGAGGTPSSITLTNATGVPTGLYTEYSLLSASAISLSNGAATTIISGSIPAGDQDISGVVCFISNTTSVNYYGSSISATTNALPSADSFATSQIEVPATTNPNPCIETPVVRVVVGSPTTYYLVGRIGFTGTGVTAYGRLRARAWNH